jgi:hypothetical protein
MTSARRGWLYVTYVFAAGVLAGWFRIVAVATAATLYVLTFGTAALVQQSKRRRSPQ